MIHYCHCFAQMFPDLASRCPFKLVWVLCVLGGALSAAAPTHHSPDLRQDLVAQQPEHLSPRVLRHHCWPGRPPPAHTPPLRGCLGAPLGFPLPWEMTQLVPVHSVLSTRIFRADTMCQAALSAQGGMSRHEAPSPAFSVLDRKSVV